MVNGRARAFLRAHRMGVVALVALAVLAIVAASRLSLHGPLPYGDGACVEMADGTVTCAIP